MAVLWLKRCIPILKFLPNKVRRFLNLNTLGARAKNLKKLKIKKGKREKKISSFPLPSFFLFSLILLALNYFLFFYLVPRVKSKLCKSLKLTGFLTSGNVMKSKMTIGNLRMYHALLKFDFGNSNESGSSSSRSMDPWKAKRKKNIHSKANKWISIECTHFFL